MPPAVEEQPAKLTQSAYRLFSQRGLNGVSLDEISAEAGVTKGCLYWHFRSKHDVIKATCAHYYRTYQRRVHSEAALEPDPVRRLERILHLSVRSCLLDEGNRIFTMEIFTLSVHDEEIRQGWRQFYESVRAFYIGLLEAAQFAGGIEVADVERTVNLMLETMEGIKLRALFEPEICASCEEARILDDLRRILGFKSTLAIRS